MLLIWILDRQLWTEALSSRSDSVLIEPRKIEQHATSLQDVLVKSSDNCCLVDASWISSHQRVGIGWSLYRKEGIKLLMESSSILQTLISLEAEAMALLKAV